MDNDEILYNWNSYEKCPDFTPVLDKLLAYKSKLEVENKILKEQEQELERVKVEVNEYGFNNLKSANKSIRSENDKIYNMLENLEKSNDSLKSKLPDQEELREAIKSINSLASWDQEDYNLEEILKLKTFLEKLK